MTTRKTLSAMITRKILSACLAVLLTPLAAHAQFNLFMPEKNAKPDTIGSLQLRVQYETRFYLDTVKQEKPLEETMILEVGSGVSKFYSYSKYICDSVYNADIANKAPQETINRHLNQYGNALMTEIICKGFPAGQVITQNAVAGFNRIRYEEKLEFPRWELTEETDTLLGMACRKAKCDFKGRHWTAWFTDEVAISEGPWKLGGLPGLILKATDSEGHYCFTVSGIELCHTRRPITAGLKNYEAVSRKQYRKIHERYYDDPIGFIQSSQPGVSMTVTDGNGNKIRPRGIPSNPIERE